MPGFMPLSAITERFARPFFDRISLWGRSILAERLGVGESDPIDLNDPPSLNDVADDLVAVMDDAEVGAAGLWGFYTAGLVAVRAVARHPHRFTKLAVLNTYVRWVDSPELEGVSEFYRRVWEDEVEHGPADEMDILSIVAPSMAGNDEFRAWWADIGRRGASPKTALALGDADGAWDISQDFAGISIPTLIVHRWENRFVPAGHAQYIADRIAGATVVKAPGIDFLGLAGDIDGLVDPVEEFFTAKPARRMRQLAAVLFTDLVDSTRRSAAEGDRRWVRLIAEHNTIAKEAVASHGGELIKSTGDGILAIFPSAGAAIDATRSIRRILDGRELQVRAGIHAGEIERLDDGDIAGLAVTIAARVMAFAQAGEIFVSGAVPPLVAGSNIEFAARDEVELKGVPGTWSLFAVV
jgi:class 3 adenylate cyclase/pimeloyl-ACP methyl ester carboxylesterase